MGSGGSKKDKEAAEEVVESNEVYEEQVITEGDQDTPRLVVHFSLLLKDDGKAFIMSFSHFASLQP